jgi:hypothetical protein
MNRSKQFSKHNDYAQYSLSGISGGTASFRGEGLQPPVRALAPSGGLFSKSDLLLLVEHNIVLCFALFILAAVGDRTALSIRSDNDVNGHHHCSTLF